MRATIHQSPRWIHVVCALVVSSVAAWAAIPSPVAVAASGTAALGGAGTQTVLAVTAVDGAFLAVGRETRNNTDVAAAWRGNATGTSWTRLAAPETMKFSGKPDSSAAGLATGDTGTVVGVGQEIETPANPKPGGYPGDALFWRARNGRDLRLTGKQTHEGDLSYRADAVAFGSGIFAAVGNGYPVNGNPTCETPLAWYSTDDGRSWTGAELAIPEGASGTVHAVAWSAAFGFVAVGETLASRCDSTSKATGAVWTSDDGKAWTAATEAPDAFSFRGIAVNADRVVLVGAGPNDDADVCQATYWTSEDLSSWQNTNPDSTQVANGVVVLADDSFIAVGATCSSATGGHAVAYTSTDGLSWALVHLGQASKSERSEMLAVAPKGARGSVIVGTRNGDGAVWAP